MRRPPPRNGDAQLQEGGWAKFRFVGSDGAGEAMWVLVQWFDAETIVGVLDNEPVCPHDPPLSVGDRVVRPRADCLATLPRGGFDA